MPTFAHLYLLKNEAHYKEGMYNFAYQTYLEVATTPNSTAL